MSIAEKQHVYATNRPSTYLQHSNMLTFIRKYLQFWYQERKCIEPPHGILQSLYFKHPRNVITTCIKIQMLNLPLSKPLKRKHMYAIIKAHISSGHRPAQNPEAPLSSDKNPIEPYSNTSLLGNTKLLGMTGQSLKRKTEMQEKGVSWGGGVTYGKTKYLEAAKCRPIKKYVPGTTKPL